MSDAPITTPVNDQKGTANTAETVTPTKQEAPKKPSQEESIYAKAKAADAKFREAAELRKETAAFEKKLIDDPEAFFNDPRIPKAKRREMAEKLIMRELEEDLQPQLSKEQQRIRELEEYKASVERKEMTVKEKEEEAQYQKVVESRREALAATFQEALSHTALSKHDATSAEVVRECAVYMRICKQAGHTPSPKEIAQHVESRFMSSYQGLTETLSGEELVKFLGKGIIKKLREYDLGQLEARNPRVEPQTSTEWQSRDDRTSKRDFTSPKDILRGLRSK